MHPRHRLDLSAADVGFGLRRCLWARGRTDSEDSVLATCGLRDRALVTLSVRSGWDLFLACCGWTPGDEVIVTAITHPEMVALIEAHGFRVVVVDVDPRTLAPGLVDLAAALSDRTRAVLVVHLFGGRIDLGPVEEWARRHGLCLIEDAAQAFHGPQQLRETGADVSFTSLGLIKTATAAGGAVVIVGDAALRSRMAVEQARWPVQSRRSYAGRLLKAAALLALSCPPVYTVLFNGCRWLGRDPDDLINGATRSFSPGPGSMRSRLSQLRRRPSAALMAVMARRLERFDGDRLRRRAAAGEALAARLPGAYATLGAGAGARTHWLFPVLAPDPDRLRDRLRRAGIDASRGTSNLQAVQGSGQSPPPAAARAMGSVVYLPAYPELPPRVLARMIQVVRESDPQWPVSRLSGRKSTTGGRFPALRSSVRP